MKKKLTSGEWLGISLTVFYAILSFIVALGADGSHTAMNKNNIFNGLAELIHIPQPLSYSGLWIMLIFVLVFLIVFAILVVFIRRFFLKNKEKPYSFKAICFYVLAFALCFWNRFWCFISTWRSRSNCNT